MSGGPTTDGPARGLRSSLDIPVAGVPLRRERIAVGGWVTHRHRDALGVIVSVDGEVRVSAPVDQDRDYIAAAHPRHQGAMTSGFTAEVDLRHVGAERVRLDVSVVLGPRDGESPDHLRVTPFASGTWEMTDVVDAHFLLPTGRTPGPARVYGQAECPGGVSHVEVFLDGRSVGPARTCLPGRYFDIDQGPASSIATFEASVTIPADRPEVTLTARCTSLDGTVFDAQPLTFEVTPPPRSTLDPERLELVRARSRDLARRLGEGRRVDGPLRVLVVTHDLGLGGGQLYLQELLKRLAGSGIHCCVVSPRSGVLVEEIEALGFPVEVTGAFDVHDPEGYESQVRQIMSFAAREGCEVALVNTLTAFAGADAAQRLGLEVAWAIHESFELDQFWIEAYTAPYPTYAAERARGALAATHRAVFEASATRDLYAPVVPEGAGVVVPYGVDFGEIDDYRQRTDRDAVRRELGIGTDTILMLCMGTMEPRKAQANIAQAFASSTGLRGRDVVLVFVGARPGDRYTETVHELVELHQEQRVRIEPIQPDTYRWYLAADVLVCASDIESLPRSMLEVMAFEHPVASTDVFGVPELLTDGVDGFLCPTRDQGALVGMLERVAGLSTTELATMGARARNRVLERHDPTIYATYFHDELHELARGSRPGQDEPGAPRS